MAEVPIINDLIKLHLDRELGREEKTNLTSEDAKESFTNYIVRFVDESQAGNRLTAKETKHAAHTLAGYMKFKCVLDRYQTETGNSTEYDVYSIPYYDTFKLWLTNKGLTLNYVGTLLKDLKVMLKQSHIDGLHENTIYQNPKFKKLVDVMSLTTNAKKLQT